MEIIDLKHIIKDLEYYHVFQPIMDFSTERVIGYEALLRSQHFKNPEVFFNYAREQDQLVHLDMNSVFSALHTWREEKTSWRDLYLFVNIFPSTLLHPDFYLKLQRFTAENNIYTKSIVFEINENEKTADAAMLKKRIIQLKELGFLVALDDVGKGESSLLSLLEIEPNFAKVDRYFAKNLTTSPKKQRVIELLVQLLGEDTTVILEGIENIEDLRRGKELGVSFGQGFFLGKPKPLHHYMELTNCSKLYSELLK